MQVRVDRRLVGGAMVLSVPQAEKDSAKLSLAYNEAVKELDVLRRSAVVNQVYGGWRLAVEQQNDDRERGKT